MATASRRDPTVPPLLASRVASEVIVSPLASDLTPAFLALIPEVSTLLMEDSRVRLFPLLASKLLASRLRLSALLASKLLVLLASHAVAQEETLDSSMLRTELLLLEEPMPVSSVILRVLSLLEEPTQDYSETHLKIEIGRASCRERV